MRSDGELRCDGEPGRADSEGRKGREGREGRENRTERGGDDRGHPRGPDPAGRAEGSDEPTGGDEGSGGSPAPATPPPVSRLVCSGCGYESRPDEPFPFRCARAGTGDADDGRDHVLGRVLDVARADPDGAAFRDPEPNPFLRYRSYLHAYHHARAHGLTEDDYRAVVHELDQAVARVDGRGFHVTPLEDSPELARALGVRALWIKDETRNVAGSHKARHLFGVALWLALQERLGVASGDRPLAVASCGNAALAAAVVARAVGRRLQVFVPPDADPRVTAELERHAAEVRACPRQPGETGDPCVRRFREAVHQGALPFTCQGSENGLVLDGGATLALETISELAAHGTAPDRVFVQVGGGALASAWVRALEEAQVAGALARLPRVHAVQTEGGHPLALAYERVVRAILARFTHETRGAAIPPAHGDARADFLRDHVPPPMVDDVLRHAALNRADFMQPWPSPPQSLATGILDDETYDWWAVVRGMVKTGGHPVVASEDTVREAHRLAHASTPIPVDPTGTAGLAGALTLMRAVGLSRDESMAVLFTGVERH